MLENQRECALYLVYIMSRSYDKGNDIIYENIQATDMECIELISGAHFASDITFAILIDVNFTPFCVLLNSTEEITNVFTCHNS